MAVLTSIRIDSEFTGEKGHIRLKSSECEKTKLEIKKNVHILSFEISTRDELVKMMKM